jgi:hypothetical protein
MSDLLQQAIIDATALKEAAIKNAENTLVEKYSHEFNETVKKLLEQETAIPTAVDPTTNANLSQPVDSSMIPPESSVGLQADQTNKKDVFSNVKTAFLDGPDDELITINFDQIKNTMMEMFDQSNNEIQEEYDRTGTRSEDVAKDALAAGAPLEEESELDEANANDLKNSIADSTTKQVEEENLEEYELEEDLLDEMDLTSTEGESLENLSEDALEENDAAIAKLKSDAANYKKLANDADTRALQMQAEIEKQNAEKAEKAAEDAENIQSLNKEEIELSEEELMELAEELRVDLKPESQGRGYMGSTTVEKQRLMDVERAAARDDKEVKKREEEKEKLADLVKENVKLKSLNNKMMSMLETLKEEVEKINVSNAKLLYTNKALGNISLNERQKNQIVESISKADSVLAAKTIYETIQNAIETASAAKEAPQTLRETLNRAQSPFVVKKTAANSLNDLMAERMKALAGIKK